MSECIMGLAGRRLLWGVALLVLARAVPASGQSESAAVERNSSFVIDGRVPDDNHLDTSLIPVAADKAAPQPTCLHCKGVCQKTPWCRFSRWFDITVSGHLNHGFVYNSWNASNPPGGYGNLPAAGLPYRANNYNLNQYYLAFERPTDVTSKEWDFGGRVDVLYGSDYIFMRSRGLEADLDFNNKWNPNHGSSLYGKAMYGVAMPQLYGEFATERMTLRVGHFFSLFGHEELLPTENFYYTNSYALFYNGYGEGAPVTGLQVQYQLTDQFQVACELHRGSVNWEDNNDRMNVVGFAEWQNVEGDVILCYSCDVGPHDDAGQDNVFSQSIVLECQLTDAASYILNSSYGFEEHVATDGGTGQWYGFANYLAYDISDKWTVGLRYELYDNVDGVRTLALSSFTENSPGIYHAITLGVNYLANDRVKVRPELRWDWFDADAGVGPGPFGDGRQRSQFLMAVDAVWDF